MPEPKSPKDLRSFGLIVGGGFTVIGLWPLVRHGVSVRMWALEIAAALILAGLLFPRALRYPYRGWMFIGHCLGWLNVRILMTLIFYVVFTPAALFMRMIGRDAMTRKYESSAKSYRVIKAPRQSSHLSHPF
jgi:hypothetical protein